MSTCLFVSWVLSFLINVALIIKHPLCFSIAFSLLVDPHQHPLIPLPATTSFLCPDSQQNFFERVVHRQGLSVCISATLSPSLSSSQLMSSVTALVKVTNDLHLVKSIGTHLLLSSICLMQSNSPSFKYRLLLASGNIVSYFLPTFLAVISRVFLDDLTAPAVLNVGLLQVLFSVFFTISLPGYIIHSN